MRLFPALLMAMIGGLLIQPLPAAPPAAPPAPPAPPRAPTVTPSHVGRGSATAVLAGGCFWGMEAVFEHVKGVTDVVSGYAGGTQASADYGQVSTGMTGHAEAVRITYDPGVISFDQLLRIYFTVAHNPTERNHQGPDVGSQYRSAIFFVDAPQQRAAMAAIAKSNRDLSHDGPIVTEVVPLRNFYPAESYHQNYIVNHPTNPYVVVNDLPKLAQLKIRFPALYRDPQLSGGRR